LAGRSIQRGFSEQVDDRVKTSKYVEAKTRYLPAKRIFEAAQLKYSEMMFERMR